MKSDILKVIADAGRPLTAQEIAATLDKPSTAVRVTLRTMVEAKTVKAIEAIGAVARYATPEMKVTPDGALPKAQPVETAPLSLDELLADARDTPAKSSRSKADELMPAVQLLRDRGHGWKDCEQWLRVRGHVVSWQTLSKAHQVWAKARAAAGGSR